MRNVVDDALMRALDEVLVAICFFVLYILTPNSLSLSFKLN